MSATGSAVWSRTCLFAGLHPSPRSCLAGLFDHAGEIGREKLGILHQILLDGGNDCRFRLCLGPFFSDMVRATPP